MAESTCPHHERIAADVERQQRWIGDLQSDLRAHCNGGSNHVTRREVDGLRVDLDACSESIRRMAETVAGLRAGQAWWEKLLWPVVTAGLAAGLWLKH